MIELLTKEDIRQVLQQELPAILSALLPKPDEAPVTEKVIRAYFGLSAPTIQKYRDQGKIPYIRIGKSYRYIKSDVKKSLTNHGLI
jgi:excisionase family DNA binding protein